MSILSLEARVMGKEKKNSITQSFSIPVSLLNLVKEIEGEQFSWSKIITSLLLERYDSDSLVDKRVKEAARKHSDIMLGIEDLTMRAGEQEAIIEMYNKKGKKKVRK